MHYEEIPLKLHTLRNLLQSGIFISFCQIKNLNLDEMTAVFQSGYAPQMCKLGCKCATNSYISFNATCADL